MKDGRIANASGEDNRREGDDIVFMRYLLGELPEAERDRFEDEYLANEAVHEQLLAFEYELIDAYLRGELSRIERQDFEKRYTTTIAGREKLANARALVTLAEPPARAPDRRSAWSGCRDLLAGLWSPAPRVVFGTLAAGAAVLLLAFVILADRHAPKPTIVARSVDTAESGPSAVPPRTVENAQSIKSTTSSSTTTSVRPEALSPPPQLATAYNGSNSGLVELRATADELKRRYEQMDRENMAAVDGIVRSGRCDNVRVSALLTPVRDSLNAWTSAEIRYWATWADSETQRAHGDAAIEANAKREAAQIEADKAHREELLRRKETIEKFGKPTQEIARQVDSLVADIDSITARLGEAEKSYADLHSRLDEMKASVAARLGDSAQYRQRVEAYASQMQAFYAGQQAVAEQACNR